MNDLVLKYYESEMRYLREAGKEFARAHPDRAAYLNLDRVGDRDPYVERLFEGFAFLTGKLRQKLDDDYPELTEGLVSLLWPHYLRMIPWIWAGPWPAKAIKPPAGPAAASALLWKATKIALSKVGPWPCTAIG